MKQHNKLLMSWVAVFALLTTVAGCGTTSSPGNDPGESLPKQISQPKTPVNSAGISQPKVSSPHITVESIQENEDSLTLYMTHGTMQTAYQNPKIRNGVFNVTLINASLAPNFSLSKTYTTNTTNGMSYYFTKSSQNLLLTVNFSSNPPTSVQTSIGGGFIIGFTFAREVTTSVPPGPNPEHIGFPVVIREGMDPLTKAPPIPLLAPSFLAMPNSTTAISGQTYVYRDGYGMNLYALPSPVPVNSPKLKSINQLYRFMYASFGGRGYETPILALRAVNGVSLSLMGTRKAVDLGNGIAGTVYQAKSSSIIVWHEGRWTIEVGNYLTPSPSLDLAKKMVLFLHTNFLPVPDVKGIISVWLRSDEPITSIEWMRGEIAYGVSSSRGPMLALKMAVSMRPYYAAG